MSAIDRYLAELSETVWQQTLGVPLRPLTMVPGVGDNSTVEGQVQITGSWTGTLVFQCSRAAARRAAALMFGGMASSDSADDLQDAVGEIANMIGGNLKTLLSDGGCCLSPPTVSEGRGYSVGVAGSRIVCRRTFASEAEPIVVTLLERQ